MSENDPLEFVAEPKIDGLSFSAVYKNGVLFSGATRGDGSTGEDITANLKTIKQLPISLNRGDSLFDNPTPELIDIRGEVYMSKKDFFELNKIQEEKKQKISWKKVCEIVSWCFLAVMCVLIMSMF